MAHSPHVVPKPVALTPLEGVFPLSPRTQIAIATDAEAVADYLRQLLRPATGCPLDIKQVSDSRARPDTILLALSEHGESLGTEGYSLTVTPESIVIRAPRPAGLFYGVQTLRQLLPAEIERRNGACRGPWVVPAVEIIDEPRFRWRGLCLDVARHFFPVDFVKRYIDLLALHKMNVLHLHLTEDQGWRIEIKKYPRLTDIGSKREATPIPSNRKELDGKPYEGFYTQDQIRDMVQYAASRFVTVVPEVEMPGHCMAALAAYPALGCTGGPYKVRTYWGIEEDVYCAGNDEVYTFLQHVLTEVFDMFPGQFIHIGGDECPKGVWEQCPRCQARIKQEGLSGEAALQSYFIKRIEAFVNANGRRLIGWDEILEGGLAPNASVMSWRGVEGGVHAASAGHDVVMSPKTHCYFDYYQSRDQEHEPPAIGGFIPLEEVYSFDPIPPELPADKVGHILGAQGNVWTEYMPSNRQVEYMTFPRASALSEVLWTPRAACDYSEFTARLRVLLHRLKALDVSFRDPFPDSPT